MRTFVKRLLLVPLAVAILVGLAGCGGTGYAQPTVSMSVYHGYGYGAGYGYGWRGGYRPYRPIGPPAGGRPVVMPYGR